MEYLSLILECIHEQVFNQEEQIFVSEINNTKDFYEKLSAIVAETFYSIINYTNENKEILAAYEEEYKIIDAVSKTLEIKTLNLKDGQKYFIDEIENFLKINTLELPKRLTESILNVWENYKIINGNTQESLDNFFYKIVEEETKNMLPLAKKIAIERKKKFDNKILELKKNNILFEISTFNEMLNYSISHLKISTEIDVLMYVQIVEEANSMINTTLVSHNIRAIVPVAHQEFSAKEHEVIMVEENASFKKGEIIRVSNNGYKQDDKVIIRASVIVAS